MLHNQNDSLMKDPAQLFIGNQDTAGFDVWNGMSPTMLVNIHLGSLHQERQLGFRHKGIFYRRQVFHAVVNGTANGIAVKNVLLGVQGLVVVILVKDGTNGARKQVTELSLFL